MADDGQLLAAAAAGDGDAFARFYRAHLALVVAFFRRRVRSDEAVFDLTAETFAAAALSAASFVPDERPAAAWLLGIARNKWRESARRGRVEAQARVRLGLEPIALEDEDLLAVQERASAGEPQLDRLLAELPEHTRRALEARVVDERPYADIATELGCSEQVVRQRVHRGLRRLRAGLEADR